MSAPKVTGTMQIDDDLTTTLQAKWGVPVNTSGVIFGPDALGVFWGQLMYACAGTPPSTFNNLPPGVWVFDTTNYVNYLKTGAIGTGTWKYTATLT